MGGKKSGEESTINSRINYRLHASKDYVLLKYLSEIGKYQPLTRDEEYTLANRIQRGDNLALEKLVESALRFVVKVALKYEGMGLDIKDLIEEGNIGLMRAAYRYNPTGGRFLTYAGWWIKKTIMRALDEQTDQARVPTNFKRKLAKVIKIRDDIESRLHRKSTWVELCDEVGKYSISENDLIDLFNVMKSPKSLNDPAYTQDGSDDGKKLSELVPSNTQAIDEQVMKNRVRKDIEDAMSLLKDKESIVLTLYYGLGDRERMTLQEVGSILGVTRERVRQIKDEAINKLRRFYPRRKLEPYG